MKIEKIIEELLLERDAEVLHYSTEEAIKSHKERCDYLIDLLENKKDGGWIPCEIAVPKEATTYEVTCEIVINSKKQYITTYALFGTEGEWICRHNERVIAWKEPSAPYQKGE